MSASSRPIEFRNTRLGATVAVLQAAEPPLLADAMHKMLGGMPDFFNGEALVLDFSALADHAAPIDWAGLNSLMRRFRLQPIGVIGLASRHAESARRAGLAELDGAIDGAQSAPPPAPPPQPAAPPPEPSPPPRQAPAAASTMFVDRMLRSGQQIYAQNADLVIIGGVSPGAEVIADGSIHCYGPLRGRAIAGARGEHGARIIASNFGPELISIAGIFRTFEGGIPAAVAGRAAQARLAGSEQSLHIEALHAD